jgi:hypothetical protein
MNLRATLRTLLVSASLVATAAVCGGWKWDLLPH